MISFVFVKLCEIIGV